MCVYGLKPLCLWGLKPFIMPWAIRVRWIVARGWSSDFVAGPLWLLLTAVDCCSFLSLAAYIALSVFGSFSLLRLSLRLLVPCDLHFSWLLEISVPCDCRMNCQSFVAVGQSLVVCGVYLSVPCGCGCWIIPCDFDFWNPSRLAVFKC